MRRLSGFSFLKSRSSCQTNSEEIYADAIGEISEKMFLFYSFLAISVIASYIMLGYFIFSMKFATVASLLAIVVISANTAYYQISKNKLMACSVFIGTLLCLVSYSASVTGGRNSPAIYWLVILPLLAGILMGRNSLLSTIISCLASYLLILAIDSFFTLPVDLSPQMLVYYDIIILPCVIFFTGYIAYIFLDRLNLQNEQLRTERSSITSLLRVVSHDIANPLAIVAGSTELALKKIKKADSQNEVENKLHKIKRASTIMQQILNEVRDFESIRSGKRTLHLSPIHLRSAFQNAEFIFSRSLKEKHIKLHIDIYENIYVLAEQNSLCNQVINNLIANAIKFSFENTKIKVTAKPDSNDEDFIVINIIDQGIGIPEDVGRNLFDQFAVTNRKGTAGEPGTGFGMPIVANYIKHFGGQIKISSQVQKAIGDSHGTTVSLLLKKAQPPEANQA